MSLRIFNTASSREERFSPVNERMVGMYICGPTTYDYAHVGHAKTYLFYDVVKRYLLHLGYKVKHVQNFTDIDENIFRRGLRYDIGPLELSSKYIEEFLKDMDALKVLRADIYPKTTEHIDDAIELTERLVERGAAYVVDGDVYFDVGMSKGFGRLIHEKFEDVIVDGLNEAPPENLGRKALFDFAVWKKAKPWEIGWDSPWGKGRPGWHTECAVMSHKYLGPTVDIHGGGIDLIFPHHESEGLLFEILSGRPSTKYWIHNQFVTFEGEKMSKSTGNLVTIRKALAMAGPDALRLYLLSVHYRKRMGFSIHGLMTAKVTLDGYREIASQTISGEGAGPKSKRLSMKALRSHISDFYRSMDNDFDTPRALSALRDLMCLLDVTNPSDSSLEIVKKALLDFQNILGIDLGVE